ncbi:hypothetical protein Q3H58_003371 [Pseudomonas psychrotolerans]|nr:hypothetical protein [Pseudomonas psychrotolerans]
MRQAPAFQLLHGEQLLQHDQGGQGQELAGDQGDVLEAGIETAAFLSRHLAQVGGGGAVFTAYREALQQARQDQHDRCGDADAGIAGGEGDDQGAGAHHDYRDHQRGLASGLVGVEAHQPAADGTHEKAHGEDGGDVEQLGGLVALGEEGLGEVQGEGSVDVPVEPLDQVADRTTEDGFDALRGGLGRGLAGREGSGALHRGFLLSLLSSARSVDKSDCRGRARPWSRVLTGFGSTGSAKDRRTPRGDERISA